MDLLADRAPARPRSDGTDRACSPSREHAALASTIQRCAWWIRDIRAMSSAVGSRRTLMRTPYQYPAERVSILTQTARRQLSPEITSWLPVTRSQFAKSTPAAEHYCLIALPPAQKELGDDLHEVESFLCNALRFRVASPYGELDSKVQLLQRCLRDLAFRRAVASSDRRRGRLRPRHTTPIS